MAARFRSCRERSQIVINRTHNTSDPVPSVSNRIVKIVLNERFGSREMYLFLSSLSKKLKFVGKDGKILIYGLLAKLLNMAMLN